MKLISGKKGEEISVELPEATEWTYSKSGHSLHFFCPTGKEAALADRINKVFPDIAVRSVWHVFIDEKNLPSDFITIV